MAAEIVNTLKNRIKVGINFNTFFMLIMSQENDEQVKHFESLAEDTRIKVKKERKVADDTEAEVFSLQRKVRQSLDWFRLHFNPDPTDGGQEGQGGGQAGDDHQPGTVRVSGVPCLTCQYH